eukprot:TRINITY_DN6152_c0_g3_i1.p1 TRINITY_DN6152_c0_g3~~TRINITY_DN6152_c0_g3_i1.p1  ORF type:complete len:783 (-),score=202.04 TRINITY_DN6152_c0_g3_i1:302-2650(-)
MTVAEPPGTAGKIGASDLPNGKDVDALRGWQRTAAGMPGDCGGTGVLSLGAIIAELQKIRTMIRADLREELRQWDGPFFERQTAFNGHALKHEQSGGLRDAGSPDAAVAPPPLVGPAGPGRKLSLPTGNSPELDLNGSDDGCAAQQSLSKRGTRMNDVLVTSVPGGLQEWEMNSDEDGSTDELPKPLANAKVWASEIDELSSSSPLSAAPSMARTRSAKVANAAVQRAQQARQRLQDSDDDDEDNRWDRVAKNRQTEMHWDRGETLSVAYTTMMSTTTSKTRDRRTQGRNALLRSNSSALRQFQADASQECGLDNRKKKKKKSGEFFAGDMIVAICILLNGLCFGLQAEYMAQNKTDDTPDVYMYLEIVFCVVFSTELAAKAYHHKWDLYRVPTWRWNIFDTSMVCCQFIDIFLETAQIGFVRLLRVFRLLRILRLVRLLHFFDDMNVVAEAIFASLKFLFGTCLLLFGLMYIFGIFFCQLVTAYRIDKGSAVEDPNLVHWWGSLTRCMLSLYEAILGGVDWDTIISPLFEVSSAVGFTFLLYIAFAVLAMMNVITGIFVDSAIRQAQHMKDDEFTDHLRKIYSSMLSEDDAHRVSRRVFMQSMCQPSVQEYISGLGVEFCDTATLFNLLDENNCGYVSMDALVKGMVRLRAGAKFLDVMALLSQIESGMDVIFEELNRGSTPDRSSTTVADGSPRRLDDEATTAELCPETELEEIQEKPRKPSKLRHSFKQRQEASRRGSQRSMAGLAGPDREEADRRSMRLVRPFSMLGSSLSLMSSQPV